MNPTNQICWRRLLLGWAIFCGGLILSLWLHTFQDRIPHRLILPALFLSWIVLGVCAWDGLRVFRLRWRISLILVHLAGATIASTLLVQHFLAAIE